MKNIEINIKLFLENDELLVRLTSDDIMLDAKQVKRITDIVVNELITSVKILLN